MWRLFPLGFGSDNITFKNYSATEGASNDYCCKLYHGNGAKVCNGNCYPNANHSKEACACFTGGAGYYINGKCWSSMSEFCTTGTWYSGAGGSYQDGYVCCKDDSYDNYTGYTGTNGSSSYTVYVRDQHYSSTCCGQVKGSGTCYNGSTCYWNGQHENAAACGCYSGGSNYYANSTCWSSLSSFCTSGLGGSYLDGSVCCKNDASSSDYYASTGYYGYNSATVYLRDQHYSSTCCSKVKSGSTTCYSGSTCYWNGKDENSDACACYTSSGGCYSGSTCYNSGVNSSEAECKCRKGSNACYNGTCYNSGLNSSEAECKCRKGNGACFKNKKCYYNGADENSSACACYSNSSGTYCGGACRTGSGTCCGGSWCTNTCYNDTNCCANANDSSACCTAIMGNNYEIKSDGTCKLKCTGTVCNNVCYTDEDTNEDACKCIKGPGARYCGSTCYPNSTDSDAACICHTGDAKGFVCGGTCYTSGSCNSGSHCDAASTSSSESCCTHYGYKYHSGCCINGANTSEACCTGITSGATYSNGTCEVTCSDSQTKCGGACYTSSEGKCCSEVWYTNKDDNEDACKCLGGSGAKYCGTTCYTNSTDNTAACICHSGTNAFLCEGGCRTSGKCCSGSYYSSKTDSDAACKCFEGNGAKLCNGTCYPNSTDSNAACQCHSGDSNYTVNASGQCTCPGTLCDGKCYTGSGTCCSKTWCTSETSDPAATCCPCIKGTDYEYKDSTCKLKENCTGTVMSDGSCCLSDAGQDDPECCFYNLEQAGKNKNQYWSNCCASGDSSSSCCTLHGGSWDANGTIKCCMSDTQGFPGSEECCKRKKGNDYSKKVGGGQTACCKSATDSNACCKAMNDNSNYKLSNGVCAQQETAEFRKTNVKFVRNANSGISSVEIPSKSITISGTGQSRSTTVNYGETLNIVAKMSGSVGFKNWTTSGSGGSITNLMYHSTTLNGTCNATADCELTVTANGGELGILNIFGCGDCYANVYLGPDNLGKPSGSQALTISTIAPGRQFIVKGLNSNCEYSASNNSTDCTVATSPEGVILVAKKHVTTCNFNASYKNGATCSNGTGTTTTTTTVNETCDTSSATMSRDSIQWYEEMGSSEIKEATSVHLCDNSSCSGYTYGTAGIVAGHCQNYGWGGLRNKETVTLKVVGKIQCTGGKTPYVFRVKGDCGVGGSDSTYAATWSESSTGTGSGTLIRLKGSGCVLNYACQNPH